MTSAGHHHTADGFGCSPTIVFGNGSSKGPKLVGNSRGSLTAAQKKFLKREYKRADGRMDGGVSPAWGKHALKAAKDSSAKLSSPSTRDIMEMIGRYDQKRHLARPTPPVLRRPTAISRRAIAAGAAFVTCFAIVFASRPGSRPMIVANDVDQPPIVIAALIAPIAPSKAVVVSAASTPDGSALIAAAGPNESTPAVQSDPAPSDLGRDTVAPAVSAATIGAGSTPEATVQKALDVPTPEKGTFAGLWGADRTACSTRNKKGLLPTLIDADGARAGETFCRFKKKKETETGWNFVANCSNPRERWTANVRLKVQGDKLTWSSERGSQSYVRCEPGMMMAQVN